MNRSFAFAVAFMVAACGSRDTIRISGQLEEIGEGTTAYIKLMQNQQEILVDSFEIKKKGAFIKEITVNEPGFYRIEFDQRNHANVILNNEDVEIYKNPDPKGNKYLIKGSKDTDLIQELAEKQLVFQNKVESLNEQFGEARMNGDIPKMEKLQQQYLAMVSAQTKLIKDEIWAMDSSIAGILSLNFLQKLDDHVWYLDSLSIKYEEQLPNSRYTAELRDLTESLKLLAIGSIAPEIKLPTPNGDSLALSDLKGKHVLLDFWAAWCGPCRRENPNVRAVYQKYHNQGFEILSVSLDRNRDSWVEAIEEDQMNWHHVSDLQYFNSEAAQDYQINAIPATFLIDPKGKIIAKNLRGESLEQKLREIFGESAI